MHGRRLNPQKRALSEIGPKSVPGLSRRSITANVWHVEAPERSGAFRNLENLARRLNPLPSAKHKREETFSLSPLFPEGAGLCPAHF
jgi:hypothetical protein